MIQQSHYWAVIQKKMKTLNLKRYMYPSVYNNSIHSSQDMETAQVPMNRRLV